MSEKTKISWCDSTVNFWSGCAKVFLQHTKGFESGCLHCYAEALSKRNQTNAKTGERIIGQWGDGAPRKLHESAFKDALRLNRRPWVCDRCGSSMPGNTQDKGVGICRGCVQGGTYHRRRNFCLSLGDILDPEAPVEWLARALDTVRRCDQCVWFLCSKRWESWYSRMAQAANKSDGELNKWIASWIHGTPPSNILGLCSVENQAAADARIPQFITVPLACRGISVEPLLSEIHFASLNGISWMIVGCESGPKRRFQAEYESAAMSILRQGKDAHLAVFHKQMPIIGKVSHDPSEWPEDMRSQEWPKGF